MIEAIGPEWVWGVFVIAIILLFCLMVKKIRLLYYILFGR